MSNKAIILFERKTTFAASEILHLLTQAGWDAELFDINKSNFAKKLFFRLSEKFWNALSSLFQTAGFPDRAVKWAQGNSVKHRIPSVLAALRSFQPPLIVSTSKRATLIADRLKSKQLYRGKLAQSLTGYYVDPSIVSQYTDLYLCNSEKQTEILKQFQVDSSKCAVIKPTLPEEFFQKMEREEAASKLGLLTTMPTVVLVAEETNPVILRESFLKLVRSSVSFQLVAICGQNSSLKEVMEKITVPVRHPVKAYSQHNDLPALLSAASVIVGPLSPQYMSRASAKRVPILITDPESMPTGGDLRYLMEQNAVVYGRIPAEVVFLVESLFEGRKLTNTSAAHDLLALPKNSLFLTDALLSIMPNKPAVKVQNYQQ